jgi:hypothetical protein
MLLLNASQSLSLVTSSAAALTVQASYVDLSGTGTGTVTPAPENTAISSATTTTVVGSPTGAVRNVKFLSIRNNDPSATNTITLQYSDGTILIEFGLLAGYLLVFDENGDWRLYTPTMALVDGGSAGGGGALTFVNVTASMSPYAASPNTMLFVDVSGGSVIITIPTLSLGQQVGVKHAGGNIVPNGITVQGTGQNLEQAPFNPTGTPSFASTFVMQGAQATGSSFNWGNGGESAGLNLF